MRISVVMCTRNRAKSLERVLESAAAMHVPAKLDWEFVLVDNGSTDETPAVVQRFASRLPIRRVVEPEAGLSNARNRGVAEARGDYICWTDDDVVIDPGWLAAYAEAFDRHPDAAFFGGVIEPVLEGETPDWFHENRKLLSNLIAERDLGAEIVSLSEKNNVLPYGANYAVRTKDQRKHPYDPALGVSSTQRRLGEESKSLFGIIDDGGIGYWVPQARVRHLVPRSRQTLDYIETYQRSAGETWAYLTQGGARNFIGPDISLHGRHIFGVPSWVWRDLVRHRLMFHLTRSQGKSSVWLSHWMNYAYLRGALEFWMRSGRRGSVGVGKPS